jgi:hypothetical protein
MHRLCATIPTINGVINSLLFGRLWRLFNDCEQIFATCCPEKKLSYIPLKALSLLHLQHTRSETLAGRAFQRFNNNMQFLIRINKKLKALPGKGYKQLNIYSNMRKIILPLSKTL